MIWHGVVCSAVVCGNSKAIFDGRVWSNKGEELNRIETCGMVWYGMVWYGLVLYGMVRYCMVWKIEMVESTAIDTLSVSGSKWLDGRMAEWLDGWMAGWRGQL